MADHTTTRFGLTGFDPTGSELVTNLPSQINPMLDQIDAKMTGWASGVIAGRGTAGTLGRTYFATDVHDGGAHGTWYFDDGTAWLQIFTASRGVADIPTTQTRSVAVSGTGYGLIGTGDSVTVTLPADGRIAIRYQATWQESAAGKSRAAVFIGSNQLKGADSGQSPVTLAATNGGTTNTDTALVSCPFGVASFPASTGYADVTTGQVIGLLGDGGITIERGGTTVTTLQAGSWLPMAPCEVFAPAGTYAVSVQFKVAVGSVTIKNRKLWVEAVPGVA